MRHPAKLFVALLVLALALVCACSKPRARERSALRIVSLSPSTTEAVFAVGAGSRLVGRSRYCDFPPEVTKLPQVGGYVDPSLEAILALKPDLVIGARGPAGSVLADKLAARGIDTFFPPTETFDGIEAMIAGIGERTGNVDAAKERVSSIHGHIAGIERAVKQYPRTRVLVVYGLEPLSVAGPASFADEMIRRAGGANVVTQGAAYPTINIEHVLALDPELIVNAAMMEERASERLRKDAPGWSRVRAVQSGRIATLTDESVLRPGPRIATGLALLARALHPEAERAIDAAGDARPTR